MSSTKYGGTVKQFESKVNKFTKFFAIRDQEVFSQTKSPEKSSKQIKLENMISSIPMFAESAQKTRMFHMKQTASEKKFFRPLLRTSQELALHPSDSQACLANPYNPALPDSLDRASKPGCKRPSTLQLGRTQLNPMHPPVCETAAGAQQTAYGQQPGPGCLETAAPSLQQKPTGHPPNSGRQSLNRSDHLNTSDPGQRALFLTQLHSSPKWQQIRNKNGRYPHIC